MPFLGRHLRKVPVRNMRIKNDRVLRKDGPTESMEVTMFGAVKILSFTPEDGLQVEAGEASIILRSVLSNFCKIFRLARLPSWIWMI